MRSTMTASQGGSSWNSESGERFFFEYTGNTGLTVEGPLSGKYYRFNGPGAIIEVDPRDARSLAAVPKLRRIPASIDPSGTSSNSNSRDTPLLRPGKIGA